MEVKGSSALYHNFILSFTLSHLYVQTDTKSESQRSSVPKNEYNTYHNGFDLRIDLSSSSSWIQVCSKSEIYVTIFFHGFKQLQSIENKVTLNDLKRALQRSEKDIKKQSFEEKSYISIISVKKLQLFRIKVHTSTKFQVSKWKNAFIIAKTKF